MKILSLIQSVLLSRKRNCIMISLCFIFTTLLFNLMIAISSDYIKGVNYISKNRYDRTAIVTHTTSLKPLSAQRISDELKRQGIKCRMEILNINNSLMYSEQSRISDEYIKLLTYNFHPDNLSLYNRYEKDSFNVSGYTTELSEYLDVELEGEKPDIIQGFDKDGSKKPVKSRLCGQQQAMRQLKLNKFTEQGYRFHQWYPFSVAPHGRHRYKNLWRFFVPIFGKEPDR